MQTVVVPATVSLTRSYNVFRFDELPDDVQEEIIQRQPYDGEYFGMLGSETVSLDIDNYYPGAFFPNGVTVRKVSESYTCGTRTKNDIEYETDSYGNANVTFAADVATCQLPGYVWGNFPLCAKVKEDIDIAFCHPSRYGNDAVIVDYIGDIGEEDSEDELSIAFETELERFRDYLEENIYNDIKNRIENAIQETFASYGTTEWWQEELANDDRLYFIDGTEVPEAIANFAN